MRVIFAGTPAFALAPLNALIDSEHTVISVYTQPDRPAGRGQKITQSPVKKRALSCGIPVYQPDHLRSPNTLETIKKQQPDVMVVVAYGLLLPPEVLELPRYGCINIHASLLPAWRGAAPIQRAILAGDDTTGVTVMQMDRGLDTGDILKAATCAIGARENASSLHDRLSVLGSGLLLTVLSEKVQGLSQPIPQNDHQASLAKKIKKSEALLDIHHSAWALDRKIRAFSGWPIAQMWLHDAWVRVWDALPMKAEDPKALLGKKPGDIIQKSKSGMDILTGDGILRLLKIQRPGKKPVSIIDFMNANR